MKKLLVLLMLASVMSVTLGSLVPVNASAENLECPTPKSLMLHSWYGVKNTELLAKELIANDSYKEVFDDLRTTDEILVQGGLFTWKLGDRTVRCSVLTPQDMQLLDNISNDVEQGVEYKDLPVKYRYHVKTALGNYLFIKAKSYDEAKKVVDSILGVGLYSPSASNI